MKESNIKGTRNANDLFHDTVTTLVIIISVANIIGNIELLNNVYFKGLVFFVTIIFATSLIFFNLMAKEDNYRKGSLPKYMLYFLFGFSLIPIIVIN